MANTSIYRNIASTGNSDICTISCWFKKDFAGVEKALFGGWRSSTDRFQIRFKSDDTIDVEFGYGGSWYSLITNRKFRDPSAWMHLVLAIDSTQGTPANREKLYINGVQETSFSTEVYMPQNNDTLMTTSGDEVMVGSSNQTSGAGTHQGHWKGCMSHVQFVDGLALAPTEFGQVDATSGIWTIKTGAYATPGTNGFFLKMEDSSNLDLDSSSNSLTFTTEGTLTSTKDNPSNNFATLNPLFNSAGYFSSNTQTLVFANGNTYAGKVTHGFYNTTLAVSSGKFYWEVKIQDTNCMFGVTAIRPNGGVSYGYDDATCYAYYPYDDRLTFAGASQGSGSGDYDDTSDKIYMFAVDATTNKMWYGRDGTFIGSPSGGTGNTFTLSADHEWSPFFQPLSTAQNNNASFNFGNGYFATTAITSAGTNASNNGDFEYDVPTGFTALCTKGINS